MSVREGTTYTKQSFGLGFQVWKGDSTVQVWELGIPLFTYPCSLSRMYRPSTKTLLTIISFEKVSLYCITHLMILKYLLSFFVITSIESQARLFFTALCSMHLEIELA